MKIAQSKMIFGLLLFIAGLVLGLLYGSNYGLPLRDKAIPADAMIQHDDAGKQARRCRGYNGREGLTDYIGSNVVCAYWVGGRRYYTSNFVYLD